MDITSVVTFSDVPTFFSEDPSTSETDAITVIETSLVIVTLTYSSSGESSATIIYVPSIETVTLVTTFSSDAGSVTTPVDTPSSPTPVSSAISGPSSSSSVSSNISSSSPTSALSFLTSHLSPSASTTSPLSTAATRPSITSNESNQNGLSTSVKIGVAVGAVLGGFAIGLSAFCLGLRLRRKRKSAADGDITPVYGAKPEKDGNEIFRREMDSTPMVQQTVAELETPTNNLIVSPLRPVDLRTEAKIQETIHEVEQTLSGIPTSIAQPHQDDPDSSRIREQASGTHEDCNRVYHDISSSPCSLKEAYDDPQLIQNPWRESRILGD
ncbi:hypothetical protein PTMSG1_09668 [Pyrenophora teres f. maculata]|nr:hypothetical protein PTMSG1_09668 [Pyrenophora teres f. maculata]